MGERAVFSFKDLVFRLIRTEECKPIAIPEKCPCQRPTTRYSADPLY